MVSRVWVFTLNNFTDEDVSRCDVLSRDPTVLDFVVGHEIGSSGTPHLQGFIKFNKTMRLRGVSVLLPRAHIEVCKDATIGHTAAKQYCRKEGRVLWNKETERQPGRRTDLARLVAALTEGGLRAAKSQCPESLIKFPSGCRLFCSLGLPSQIRPDLRVVVYLGPTGVGKSRAAFSQDPFAVSLPTKVGNQCWWDGYVGQPTIVLDEFAGQVAFRELLRILDVNPLDVQGKGIMIPVHYTKVIITSNFHPREWYPNEDYAPLARRIHGLYTSPPWDLGVLPY